MGIIFLYPIKVKIIHFSATFLKCYIWKINVVQRIVNILKVLYRRQDYKYSYLEGEIVVFLLSLAIETVMIFISRWIKFSTNLFSFDYSEISEAFPSTFSFYAFGSIMRWQELRGMPKVTEPVRAELRLNSSLSSQLLQRLAMLNTRY